MIALIDRIKKKQVHIRLYIIIPVIFGGIAALSGIVSWQVAVYHANAGYDPQRAVAVWVVISAVIGAVCGLVVVRLIMGPVDRFLQNTRHLGILNSGVDEQAPAPEKSGAEDEISQIVHVFDQVTEALSRMEAQARFPEIIGESRMMRGILSRITKVAPTDTIVLVTGESGTGKELVAEAVFKHSNRNNKPFIKLNCAAIPEGLLESELFGHEKGAFTGADYLKKGKFELAANGTIFLDEIGDMPLATQAKILRVLQDREFTRVGGNKTIKCDVRIVVATNKDLDEMVKQEGFREDLLYRIRVFTIVLPPLRDRKEDIPLLVNFFLGRGDAKEKKLEISPEALGLLMSWSWPGNIRELKNAMERAAVLCPAEEVIAPEHLPAEIAGVFHFPVRPGQNAAQSPENRSSLDEKLGSMEKKLIEDTLRKTGGVQVKAAEMLGITQRSLWHRIKKFGLDVREMKKNNK